MTRDTHEMLNRLMNAGISMDDAYALRRIAMTLHRWHELECGDSNGYTSFCVVRGNKNGCDFEYDDNGKPYLEISGTSGKNRFTRIADRERGALKRLDAIVNKYRPAFGYYVQGDPRGAPLYLLPEGVTQENYNRGIAVYK